MAANPELETMRRTGQVSIGMFVKDTCAEDRDDHISGHNDHFISRDGKVFAGTHLIVDFWGASSLDDAGHIDASLREAVTRAQATLLHVHVHHFTANGGVSGVAVLAESHISIHSWPERDYAAIDVFMCGDSDPHKAVEALREAFTPTHVEVEAYLRGEIADEGSTSLLTPVATGGSSSSVASAHVSDSQ